MAARSYRNRGASATVSIDGVDKCFLLPPRSRRPDLTQAGRFACPEVSPMAKPAIRCTGCNTPLTFHCPVTNHHCTWLTCLNAGCDVRYYDVDRGLVQKVDGTIVTWADMPSSSTPPAVTINDDDADGRPATPDA